MSDQTELHPDTPREDVPGAVPEAGLFGRIINRGGIIFATGIVLSVLILLQEVVLRYVFNAPTIWAHETTVFLCAIAFIYGGLYDASRNTHIRVVLIYDWVGGRARKVLDIFISLICMVAALSFAGATWTMVDKAIHRPDGSFRLETSGSAWDPPFPAYLKIFLLVVMLLLVVQFAILAVSYARAAITGGEEAK